MVLAACLPGFFNPTRIFYAVQRQKNGAGMAGGFIAGDFGRYCGNSNDVIYLTVVSAN